MAKLSANNTAQYTPVATFVQNNIMSVTLIDATADSLTVSWPEIQGASCYILQYKRNDGSSSTKFETLSDKLTSTQARKKNLLDEDNLGFFFQVAVPNDGNDPTAWISHCEPFFLLSSEHESSRMEPPLVRLAGIYEALTISWKSNDEDCVYEIQIRENIGGCEWKTIASSFAGNQVRKKNLSSPHGYQFRVRLANSSENAAFSRPSDAVVPLGLAEGVRMLFNSLDKSTLLRKAGDDVALVDALGGKEFILLYASASWCGPCRQYTPKLAQWYGSLDPNGRTIEVVFLSADHDKSSFLTYFAHMPWLAVNHDEDTREELLAYIGVRGIPQLAVLDGRTGRIVEANAVGKSLDASRWRSLLK